MSVFGKVDPVTERIVVAGALQDLLRAQILLEPKSVEEEFGGTTEVFRLIELLPVEKRLERARKFIERARKNLEKLI